MQLKIMYDERQYVGVTSLIFIINSNFFPFQKNCRNKDCSQKLGAALMMAQEAEQISIQVRQCSDHIPASLWDLENKSIHTYTLYYKKLVCLFTLHTLSLRTSLSCPGKIPLTP